MNLEQKFNEILTKSSNRVAIGNFVVSPFPLSTEGSALAVKITRRRSRLNSAKVAKDAEKQVAEAYQVDHVSYNLKSALRSFFHRYRVPEQQYEYQCVIMKQYVLDMQSQLLLTDLDRDQFRNLKYTLFSGKSSDDAIKGMLDQFEQGKLNICRYEISGRMISYSGLSSKKVSPGEIFFDFSLRSPGDEWGQSRFGLSPFVFTAIRLRNGL